MFVLTFVVVALLSLFVQSLLLPDVEQVAFRFSQEDAEASTQLDSSCSSRIAVVGSGITGAIAAFKLYEGYRQRARPEEQPCITVFERNPIVGGRLTRTFIYNDPARPIDTASPHCEADTF